MTAVSSEQVNALLESSARGATIYLIGIGGCGMSGLGHLLLDLGFTVAGSDLATNAEVRELELRGAHIQLGHQPDHLRSARPVLVIFSSAVRSENLEIAAAEALKIPTVRRGVVLSALLQRQRGICVAGMHGKTTTSALLAFALVKLNASPSYAVGAAVPQLGRHAKFSSRAAMTADDPQPFFVVETDESDGTLRHFRPESAILLNADEEHLDFYSDLESVCREFREFAGQTTGRLIVCADDPQLMRILSQHPRTIFYGFHPRADYRLKMNPSRQILRNGESTPETLFEVWHRESKLGEFSIALLGEKNASNAAAVIALLHQLGFASADIARGIREFRGAARRQEELHRDGHYRVFDDYGHHPNEIRATLLALKALAPRRLLVAFQPHRFTRTQYLLDQFATCFSDADRLWLTEIYSAGEDEIAGITSETLAQAIRAHGQSVDCVSRLDALGPAMGAALEPGDLVLFLGAGDITKVAHEFATQLTGRSSRKISASMLAERFSADSVVRESEPLARHTTLRVGGRADLYVEPASEADLTAVLQFCGDHHLPWLVVGRGSNLLVQDGGFRGVVICLARGVFSKIEIRGEEIHCGAGAKLKAVAVEAKRHGLGSLEFLEGIPGSVGGALRMNAGAMGGCMFEVVRSVRFMDSSGRVHEAEASAVEVNYRNCPLFKTHIALSAMLRGKPAPKEVIAERMNASSQKRWKSQPAAPSAGCIFKNPGAVPAGKLIDELGLKGTRIGGAVVSDVHGNFIVNDGTATAGDVLSLIELIKDRAKTVRGIELETEVEIVGEKPNG